LSFLFTSAQNKSSKAYVITSTEKARGQWMDVKLIDINTGEVLQSVFSQQSTYNVFNARNGDEIKIKDAQGVLKDQSKLPFHTASAACAYDAKHNRLYYTPMYINQLRYIDLNEGTPKLYYFEGEKLSTAPNLNDMANHITRMVIAADGNGYALSNDGNHFIKFTTGRKPVITDLGALQDESSGKAISIHTQASSWGGDMIADAFGNLYVISAYRNVFKINVQNRTAKHVASIQGLPANYTTNGAAIDDEGRLIVSSAASAFAYYEVDMSNWQAKRLELKNKGFDASDMATGNLAFESKKPFAELINRDIIRNDAIGVFPNPVLTRTFQVTFTNRQPGRYSIQLVDLLGRVISKKDVVIAGEGQVVTMNVNRRLAGGTYLVKVLSNTRQAVFSDKIIIQ
jgi:sugar lactone lactonase YvrE